MYYAGSIRKGREKSKQDGCPRYDLLSDFHYKELESLSAGTQYIEKDFVKVITENGGNIKKYDSFEQFELARL